MNKQIVIKDEHNIIVGKTYPRRAKQLVIKNRAKWIDDDETEILLLPTFLQGAKKIWK